jgi:hypothetical protein
VAGGLQHSHARTGAGAALDACCGNGHAAPTPFAELVPGTCLLPLQTPSTVAVVVDVEPTEAPVGSTFMLTFTL